MSRFTRCLLTLSLLLCLSPAPAWAGTPGKPAFVSPLTPPQLRVRVVVPEDLSISAPGDTLDGVTMAEGDWVLRANPVPEATNGIYVWNGAAVAMTRASLADASDEFLPSMTVLVGDGVTYKGSIWMFLNTEIPTLETTALDFGRSQTPCGVPLQPPCTDDGGALTNLETLLGEFVTLSSGAPSAGACLSALHRILDTVNVGDEYVCPGGLGSNPIISYARSDAYTEILTDDGDVQATGGESVRFQGAGGLTTEGAAGLPDVITIRPKTSHTIWIPAGAMSSSGGCSDPAEAVLLASGPKRWTIVCTDADVDSIEADFAFTVADRWNAGTLQVQLYVFSTGNNSTEIFEMDWAGQCVADGAAVAAHSATGEQSTSVVFGNQTSDLQISALSSAITLNGSCNATSMVMLRGQVDATASTVSPFSDIKILGIKVQYTSN